MTTNNIIGDNGGWSAFSRKFEQFEADRDREQAELRSRLEEYREHGVPDDADLSCPLVQAVLSPNEMFDLIERQAAAKKKAATK